ncbi:MAG: aminotransferase class I/II-fold pyridoxal phosphate-dependent enzyme [Proteobacteria bacterium]|nr:aminotransferase class I/II-fold pyridoxal phosphate-dependent enzyme [Pseudomonadota bacterium]
MRKDLFDKYQTIIDRHAALPPEVDDPFSVRMDKVLSPTIAIIDGRETILCGTNNYMGMTFNEEARKAAHDAIERFGTGTTGSRVLNGTYSGHTELEQTLRDFYGTKHAIVFSTGYLANLGILATLPGRKDFIIMDADCHASIYDGCAQGRATTLRFKHNNMADLERRLKSIPEDAGALIVAEGIYSMLGDVAPLKEIVELKKKYGAMLMLDEAHSMGFCGKTGRGVAQELGLEDEVDFLVGTFSKSVGTVGGFVVSNHPKFEVLRLAARAYVFTASLPPSVVASAKSAIETIKGADDLRERLWANAHRLHRGLKKAGFVIPTKTLESPIIAVSLHDTEQVVRFWSGLLRTGVYVNMAVPTATPQGLFLLRCSVCASHTPEQIDTIIERFVEVAKALKLPLNEKPRGGEAEKTEGLQPQKGAAAAMA